MRIGLTLRVLACALCATACDGGDATGPESQAIVRFVNAVGGATGDVVLTANGRVVGTALGYGALSAACAPVIAGSLNLAFGPVNADSTGIAGTALSTQSLVLSPGSDFTIVAAGTAATPGFVVLNNNTFTGTVGSGQAAVRFVNLVPTVNGVASSFNVFVGTGTTTAQATSLGFRSASTYALLTAGSNTLEFRDAADNIIFTNAGAELDLPEGTVNAVAILPDAAGTGYQLINITACPQS